MSATSDSTLAGSSRTVADLRHELAECKAERDAALAREAATAEVLQVINSSPGDLAPVFEALLDKALALCGASYGFIRTYDGESFRLGAMRGVPSEHTELLKQPRRPPFTGTALERLVAGESVVEIADVADQPGYTPFAQALVAAGVVRTMVWVALRKEGALLGFISVFRSEIQPFTDKQIALLQNFAAQAVIAMENARLLTETREALEQQTATAEVLQVINSSPGELGPVFDAMLEKAMRLCEASFGVLRSWDGECFHVRAVHGEPRFSDWIRARGPSRPEGDDPLARITKGAGVVYFADASDDPAYLTSPAFKDAVELSGMRSGITVSLHKDDALQGAITLYRQEVRPFTDKQIALLENFAAQAVIAMENARLINETREALHQQTATAEVLQVINSSPGDLTPVFDVILKKAHALCGSSHGALFLSDGERFMPAAMSAPELLATPLRQGGMGSDAPLVRPLLAGQPYVHVTDLTLVDHPLARAAVATGVRTLLSVPLRKDGTLIGMINAARFEVHPFSEKQIALLQNFAAQAVIAMENARLLTETREALEQQTATAEVLGVINSSPGDLAPVFDAMLEKAMRLCQGACGHVYTYDGERYHPVAVDAETRFADWFRQLGPVKPINYDSPLGRLVAGERVVPIVDAREDRGYKTNPGFREMVDISGIRSGISIALDKDGAMRGAITIYRQELRPFSDRQIALLQNFAAQAVIAMENARLITETREALEQQTATAEVLQVINSSPGDLAPVFETILEKAHTLCGAAHGVMLIRHGERFRAVAVNGVGQAFVDAVRQLDTMRPPEGSGPARLIQGEQIVHFPDLQAESYLQNAPPQLRRVIEIGDVRTTLMVPLRKDNSVIGIITAFRQEVRPFTDKQIALLQNFAAQAVIAMENARLLTETREALEQQTATAEVLQVINSSPGDLAPVFNAILEKAIRLCDADSGQFSSIDGQLFTIAAIRGEPRLAEWLRQRGPVRPGSGTTMDKILRGENLIQVVDMKNDEAYRRGDPTRRMLVDVGGYRSGLSIALRKEIRLLGAFTIHRKQVRPFTDKQIALLQSFGAQAAIAIENAQLLTETREALDQQTATAEVLHVINSSPGDLTPVFDAILEKAMRLCGAAFGAMGLFKDGKYSSVAARGLPEAYAEFRRQRIFSVSAPNTSLLASRVLHGEAIIHTLDLKAEDLYEQGDPYRRAIVDLGGARTSLGVALKKDGDVLGAIHLYRQEVRPFTDKQIALLQNFAAQAVIAMENARLIGELRERTDQVAELNRGLEARVAEQVEELGRVGRLKRFLAPQLAELIVSQGDEKILESHRREIVVVFCDLRGYTAFTETAEPEEVLDFLREYHGALGPLVAQFEGTLDQFSGDGIMVFFNDPVPIPDAAERAVKMAIAMREAAGTLTTAWRRRGRVLGFGAGIAQGYATLGQIGFADRSGYTAIGTVCNLAARLCAEAKDGQILVGQRVAVAVEETIPLEELGELALKGLTQPVVAFNVPASVTGAAAVSSAGTA